MTNPLWRPSERSIQQSHLSAFARKYDLPQASYEDLHSWSVSNAPEFWQNVWEYCEVMGTRSDPALIDSDDFLQSRWFPNSSLNFAENLLRSRSDKSALISLNESGERTVWSWNLLYTRTAQITDELRTFGINPGDRVVGLLPNINETVAAMLATTALGAVWSSCSPDFGYAGTLDRFGQIQPRVMFACTGYQYNGKHFDTRQNVKQIAAAIPSLERVIWLDSDEEDNLPNVFKKRVEDIEFKQFPFNHLLYVMYSSGTTGKPKCIVHGAGGTLLQHAKEHRLQLDLKAQDRLFFFTTTGWMMWNWLVSALAAECTLILYDGAPFHPRHALLNLIESERPTAFGVGAKYLTTLASFGIDLSKKDLSSVRCLLSTGSPLSPEGFRFVYDRMSPDVWLASISGGTDLISCFVLGNPWDPVYAGEIQGPGLGMNTAVFDRTGNSVTGERGELVCTDTFPSKPISFWDDPNYERFSSAYFERFDNVWTHGDFAEVNPDTGGYVIHGRSDTVLNPGGVRIGTAEIYRVIETIPEIVDAVCVGYPFEEDVQVLLFVVLANDEVLSDDLKKTIKGKIRTNSSPRHVPRRIFSVADVPVTRSGKIAEIAVRDTLIGQEVQNTTALSNPTSLREYAAIGRDLMAR